MKLLAFFLPLALLAAPVSHAEPLIIRSGDHATFSRITIPLPSTQDWEATQTEKGVEIYLPEFTQGFDTRSVFMRMRSDRISAIGKTESRLLFSVNCDCIASAFVSGQLLVLDIGDRGSKLTGPLLEGPKNQRPRVEAGTVFGVQRRPTIPWLGSPPPSYYPHVSDPINSPVVASSENSQEENVLREVERTLVAEVANAGSSGLLQASPGSNRSQTGSTSLRQQPPTLKAQELPEILQSPSQNIRVIKGFDLPSDNKGLPSDGASPAFICPDDGAFAIETWAQETSFSEQIGSARKNMMNARDSLVHSATIQLAKSYIYHGFGAEALGALDMLDHRTSSEAGLATIAHILEYGSAPSSSLRHLTECKTNSALWAIMAYRELPSDIAVNTAAAMRALNRLPHNLRTIIAPGLSDRLLKYGNSSAAAAALRSIQRHSAPLSPDAEMARISLQPVDSDSLQASLSEVVLSNGARSPEALAKLVKSKLTNNDAIHTDTSLLLDAYSQEFRGTEIGDTLQQLRIQALAQNKKYEEAFAALRSLAPSLSPDVDARLKTTIMQKVTLNGDDSTFIQQVFRQGILDSDTLPDTVRMEIAGRLLDLGFALEAQKVIKKNSSHSSTRRQKVLSARAALALRQPFQALADIMGVEGPEAAQIRAEALQRTGQYVQAFTAYLQSGSNTEAIEAAWLADDWQGIITQDTPTFGGIAMLLQEDQNQGAEDVGQLESAAIALSESSTAREVLENLLADETLDLQPDSGSF